MNAKLATPHGWVRMGDIAVGDEVYTPDGHVTRVLGVYPKGVRPVYKVMLRDGSSTLVCNQHLWEVERWKSSLRYTGERDENGHRKYIGTGENGRTSVRVSEVIDTDELKRRVDAGIGVDLPFVKPVEYPEADLPMDPYVLGVIIGDANVDAKGHVILSCNDEETIVELNRRGYETTLNTTTRPGKCPVYYIKGVSNVMRLLGLAGHRSWKKFIPEMYLFGSVQQRIDLLRGLMDISKKSEMEFVSVSKTLALNVQELIRSLGGRVSVNEKTGIKYTAPNQPEPKEARPAYRVQNIRLPEINPFLLERKASRWRERDKRSSGNYGNRVVSVEYMFDDEVQCILVEDERHLFLVDDYIPTHNTSNIVFLKSTDDSMIDTLQKMSGTQHRAYTNSKSVTRDQDKLIMRNEGKVTYTMAVVEEPVIKYNDMAFIAERNSIVFRAGDSPIWNRNETILPMSWRLLQNTIKQPGHEYTFQTIPTLSSAKDFDVNKNVPDFGKMLDKRMAQALQVETAKDAYQTTYEYSDYQLEQLDIDLYADEIMEVVNTALNEALRDSRDDDAPDLPPMDDDYMVMQESFWEQGERNVEQERATAEKQREFAELNHAIYAGGKLSKANFKMNGHYNHGLDPDLIAAYLEVKGDMEQDRANFTVRDGSLYSATGTPYIIKKDTTAELKEINEAGKDPNSRTYTEGEMTKAEIDKFGTYEVTDEFLGFLISLPAWKFAHGRFDAEMSRRVSE